MGPGFAFVGKTQSGQAATPPARHPRAELALSLSKGGGPELARSIQEARRPLFGVKYPTLTEGIYQRLNAVKCRAE